MKLTPSLDIKVTTLGIFSFLLVFLIEKLGSFCVLVIYQVYKFEFLSCSFILTFMSDSV